MREMTGDFYQPLLLTVDSDFPFHRVKYLGLARGWPKPRVGCELQFHHLCGTFVLIAEVEGLWQQFKHVLTASGVFVFLPQGPSERARIVNEFLQTQVRLLFLLRREWGAIHRGGHLQIAIFRLDYLVDFASSRLLGLKLKSPVAVVYLLSLDFVGDHLPNQFIRRCWQVLSGLSGSGASA